MNHNYHGTSAKVICITSPFTGIQCNSCIPTHRQPLNVQSNDLKSCMQVKHKVDKLGPYLLKQWKMKHQYVKIYLSFKQQPLLNNESHFFL